MGEVISIEELNVDISVQSSESVLQINEQNNNLIINEQVINISLDSSPILIEIVNPDTIGPPGPPGSGSGSIHNYFPGGMGGVSVGMSGILILRVASKRVL